MRECDIRLALHKTLQAVFRTEPDTLIIDELGLCQGEARVDVAVVNSSLHGYEIKSERDSLSRLPRQQRVYCRILDTVTIVACVGHIGRIYELVPDWWGIEQVMQNGEEISFVTHRNASANPSIDPYAVAQLLWRDEVKEILRRLELGRGISNKPRRVLWKKLADSLPVDQLSEYVRKTIKARVAWRSAEQLA